MFKKKFLMKNLYKELQIDKRGIYLYKQTHKVKKKFKFKKKKE